MSRPPARRRDHYSADVLVTVANQKGGVGKTTSAVFLAHALVEATGARCTILDADPQSSAARWAELAAEAGRPLTVPVLSRPTPNLAENLPFTPHVVIDTPPADPEIVAAAIEVADLVLVPTSTSTLDLSRLQATIDLASRSGKPAAVLLTRTRRTRSVGATEDSLRSAGVRLLRTHIALREALAMGFGQPVRQLHGYELVTAELLDTLPEQPYSVEAVRQRAGHALGRHRQTSVPHPQWAGFGEHRAPRPAPAPSTNPPPVGLDDDELVQRLKASMARLANTAAASALTDRELAG